MKVKVENDNWFCPSPIWSKMTETIFAWWVISCIVLKLSGNPFQWDIDTWETLRKCDNWGLKLVNLHGNKEGIYLVHCNLNMTLLVWFSVLRSRLITTRKPNFENDVTSTIWPYIVRHFCTQTGNVGVHFFEKLVTYYF